MNKEDLLVSQAAWGVEAHWLDQGSKFRLLGVHVPVLPVCVRHPVAHGYVRPIGEFSEEHRDRYVERMIARLERIHAEQPVDHVVVHHMSLLVEVGARFSARIARPLDVVAHGTALRHSLRMVPELRTRVFGSLPRVRTILLARQNLWGLVYDQIPEARPKLRVLSSAILGSLLESELSSDVAPTIPRSSVLGF